MKYSIICGSHRPNSQSLKTAKYIEKILLEQGNTTYLLDLSDGQLPQWDESFWNADPKWEKIWAPVANQLKSSDALVVISPEYHGMASAALKNFFLFAGKDEIGHKPGLIVAVSSGMGGSYPVAELRMSSYKNTRICYLPEHLILRNSEHILNEKTEEKFLEEDRYMRERIGYTLNLLQEYARALKLVRESGVVDYTKFPNGM